MTCKSDFPTEALHLLYLEAAQNIICGRLVSGDPEKYKDLAGLRAFIEFGPYDPEQHNEKFYQDILHMLYPDSIIHGKHSGGSWFHYFVTGPCAATYTKNLIATTAEHHEKWSLSQSETSKCEHHYLSICSELPIYGAVFYDTKLRILGKFWGSTDVKVTVAINGYGVCVMNADNMTLLTAIGYPCLKFSLEESTNSLHFKFSTYCNGQEGGHVNQYAGDSSDFDDFSDQKGGGATTAVTTHDVHLISRQVR